MYSVARIRARGSSLLGKETVAGAAAMLSWRYRSATAARPPWHLRVCQRHSEAALV